MIKNQQSNAAAYAAPMAILALAVSFLHTGPAQALEGANPYLNGTNIGVATGAAPPPGLYFTDTSFARPNDIYDGNGNKTGIRTSVYSTTLAAIYVPGITILGGQYVAFIRQPISYTVVKAFGARADQFGLFNTIISPINLSYNLGGGLFAAGGIVFYPPDGTHGPNRKVNISNDYATFEPGATITYLNSGLNLTALANYDINTTNNNSGNRAAQPTGKYHSGDTFNLDLTATQEFGKFTVGVGGYLLAQTTDDTVNNGQVFGPTPFNGRGNRAKAFALGPALGYQLGPVGILAYYTRDIVHENTLGGNVFWLRLATRF